MQKVQLADIVIDETVTSRAKPLDAFLAQEYADAIRTGATFPPILLGRLPDKRTLLVEGRHRLEAHKLCSLKEIDATIEDFESVDTMWLRSLESNRQHGKALTSHDLQSAVIRLKQMGYEREKISALVRIPIEKLERSEERFAIAQNGQPVAVKGGLAHLAGQVLTPRQVEFNRHYGGPKLTWQVNQLAGALENDMWPRNSNNFRAAMERIVRLWLQVRDQNDAA